MPEAFYEIHGHRPCGIEHPYNRVAVQSESGETVITTWRAMLEETVFSEDEL